VDFIVRERRVAVPNWWGPGDVTAHGHGNGNMESQVFFYEKNMESHVSESPSARHGVYGPAALSRRPQPIDWNQLRDGLSRAPAGATTAHISVAAQTLTVTGIFAERKQLAVLILLYKHKISLLNY